ncbi:MAG: hypothetical protein ACTSPB_00390 [Candidatus Thorarchaeota archaeon]
MAVAFFKVAGTFDKDAKVEDVTPIQFVFYSVKFVTTFSLFGLFLYSFLWSAESNLYFFLGMGWMIVHGLGRDLHSKYSKEEIVEKLDGDVDEKA